MDSRAQDAMWCDVCDTTTAEMHCDTCFVNLCKACVGVHMFDESIDHKIVSLRSRKTTILYPFCSEHSKKTCDMHCKHCNIAVCTLCITSDAHIGHKIMSILEKCELIKNDIQRDNDNLRSNVTPLFQELLYDVEMRIKEVEEKSEDATKLINKQCDDWHQLITNIGEQFRAEVVKTKDRGVNTLKEQKSEIEQTLTKIISVIKFKEEIQNSSELQKAIAYRSQHTLFRTPINIDFPLQMPFFWPENINRESLLQQFGSLSVNEYSNFASTAVASKEDWPLLIEPIEIAFIDTGLQYLQSIACASTNQIWAMGNCPGFRFLKLFETNECKEIKQIDRASYKHMSSNSGEDLAVNQDGELVFSCLDKRTVNILRGEKSETLLRLENWLPRGICITSTGDMLVTMTRKKQSRVVRYSGTVAKQSIPFGYKGKNTIPYSEKPFLYVTENKNRDICVSRGEVVVFKETGEIRFRYNGRYPPSNWNEEFSSNGITTDKYCHIIIAETERKCVHIIDQNGIFLQYIDCGMRKPLGLCIDAYGFLFVVDKNSSNGKIAKYKYLKEINEASIDQCKYQESNEASIEHCKYQESNEASIDQCRYQESNEANIENQEINDYSFEKSEYQESNDISIAKCKFQESNEASNEHCKYQEINDDSFEISEYQEPNDISVAKCKFQESNEASISKCKFQEIKEAREAGREVPSFFSKDWSTFFS